ncbi:unnamed protein product [Symbiodinium sp. CCMP2592]|nr:unnamed protein product [Symbiodinium sp. CCMP2592]
MVQGILWVWSMQAFGEVSASFPLSPNCLFYRTQAVGHHGMLSNNLVMLRYKLSSSERPSKPANLQAPAAVASTKACTAPQSHGGQIKQGRWESQVQKQQ